MKTELKNINAELGTNYTELTEATWRDISTNQPLTEAFIEKYADRVKWYCISEYQKLSEKFIAKHAEQVNWYCISKYQKLSEKFIAKHSDRVDWFWISAYQPLSEAFMEKHSEQVNWGCISVSQQLSERFIEKHSDRVDWDGISKYQKLTPAFIKKHDLKIDKDNWLYKTTKFKEAKVRKCGKYKCLKDYFIAYKAIRQDRYSLYNFQYKYLKGNTYETHADYTDDESSFGFSVWTEKGAREYGEEQNALIIKCKIYYRDVARLVHNSNKIRCPKITILK